jgi:hypothetical protein
MKKKIFSRYATFFSPVSMLFLRLEMEFELRNFANFLFRELDFVKKILPGSKFLNLGKQRVIGIPRKLKRATRSLVV